MSRSATAIVVASALASPDATAPKGSDYGGAPYYAPDYGPPEVIGDYGGGCWNCGYGGGGNRRPPPPPRYAGRAALRRPVQDCLQDLRRACLCVQSGRRLLRRRSTPSISGMVSRSFLRRHLP